MVIAMDPTWQSYDGAPASLVSSEAALDALMKKALEDDPPPSTLPGAGPDSVYTDNELKLKEVCGVHTWFFKFGLQLLFNKNKNLSAISNVRSLDLVCPACPDERFQRPPEFYLSCA